MKAIIQYAKISSISLDESNKIITATANATGESVQKIIDIFALLGDSTASGADEIGEALQRVASTAEGMGVSVEKAAAWISTISSITRESASTIGRSLNSIISRYSQIKEKGFNSEDATDLNQVVSALAQIGIKATDSQGQLKDFAEVMDLLGAKYNSLDKNSQSYIATVLAGTYQMNRFKTLMQNYTQSLDNYETALNSAGTAQKKFEIYQESSKAAIDKLTSSWEGFWQNSIDSSLIKNIIVTLSELIDSLDNVGRVILILTGLFTMFQYKAIANFVTGLGSSVKGLFAFKAAADGATIAVTGLQRAFGIIGIALTALTIAYTAISSAQQKAREESEKLVKIKQDEIAQLSELKQKYNELQEQQKNGVNVLNELRSVESQILDLLPQRKQAWNDEYSAIQDINSAIDEQIRKKRELIASELRSDVTGKILADNTGKTISTMNLFDYTKQLSGVENSIKNINRLLDELEATGQKEAMLPLVPGGKETLVTRESLLKQLDQANAVKNQYSNKVTPDIKKVIDYYSAKYAVDDQDF
jgi:TP901 family phage tail tape measure protein